MILKELSDLIIVDELRVENHENSEKYIFFLSHLSPDFHVHPNFESKIYTSSHIGNVLGSMRKESIPLKYFKILKNRVENTQRLSNGNILKVTMFKDEEPSGNVLYYFKINKNLNLASTAIYLGHFKQITKIMRNSTFIDLVSKGIDYLYIDNTNSKSIYHSTEQEVCYNLKELLKSHTKIILNTPEFGYEDLIKCSTLSFDFKLYIHNDITKSVFYNSDCIDKFVKLKDCDIAIIQDSQSLDFITRRFNKKKIATVRLFDFQKHFENKSYEKFGLYQFCYSSHISRMEMFSFITLIQPESIKEIYSELPKIPDFIKGASKKWKCTDEDPKYFPVDDVLDQIEDFAPKTRLENVESLEKFIENALSENPISSDISNKTEKSTDCEEVFLDEKRLTKKIRDAIHTIPKRKTRKIMTITIDSNSEKNVNNKNISKKINKSNKSNNSKQDVEQTKMDEFASLLNTNFTHFQPNESCDESEKSEFVENSHASSLIDRKKIEDTNMEKIQKEENENYFSFLDNTSVSSKEEKDDSKIVNKSIHQSTKIKQKENATVIIAYSLVENAVENFVRNNIANKSTENPSSSNKIIGKKKKLSTESNKYASPSRLQNSTASEKKNQLEKCKENNEPKCIAISNSILDNILDYKDNKVIARNEKILIKSCNNQSDDEIKNFIKEPDNTLGNSASKINSTEKNYNSFRKSLFVTENDNGKKNSYKPKEKLNKSNKNNLSKKNIKENNSNKKEITNYLRRSSTKRKRKISESDNSVEAIDTGYEDIIEIVDSSPPSRLTRSTAKAEIVQIKSKRKMKKPDVISQLYIDD